MSTGRVVAVRPGTTWIWVRRLCQVPALVAVVVAPLLGGWQRLDRNYLSAWRDHGWDLAPNVLEALPLGTAPGQAYAFNQLLGGGTAGQYFGVAAIDPVAGMLALASSPAAYGWAWLSWVIPLGLAALAGRFFCGWMCPFGSLARTLTGLLDRLPWSVPSFRAPAHRPLRFVVLALALILGALGAQWLLYFTLPHLLVQQSLYALWLMGGGGATLGALLGLMVAGVAFGPTLYCATVCPTGAGLSLLGRRRVLRLQVIAPSNCGAHCDLCDRTCWLALKPSTGDAGSDCDNCARCVAVCPKNNLHVRAVTPWRRPITRAVVGLMTGLWLTAPGPAIAAPSDAHKPRLQLEARRQVADADVHLSVVDLGGVRLGADDPRTLGGSEVSLYVVRGPRGEPDHRGRLAPRTYYQGPLRMHIATGEGHAHELSFSAPNYPYSTPRRSIYRAQVDFVLDPGDTITLEPIPGWINPAQSWEIPQGKATLSSPRIGAFAAIGALFFAGLLALSLGLRRAHNDVQVPVDEPT